MIKINRLKTVLKANPKRVILLPNRLNMDAYASKSRIKTLVNRILDLPTKQFETIYKNDVILKFNHRHPNLEQRLLDYYNIVKNNIPKDYKVSKILKLLIGAYFTQEYAMEAAALFNPSMVAFNHNESLVKEGEQVVISLRSVGEQHISSISFMSGVLDRNGQISITDSKPKFAVNSTKDINKTYKKSVYKKRTKIIENFNQAIFNELPEKFTQKDYDDLKQTGTFKK